MTNFARVPVVPGPVLETYNGEELFPMHPDIAQTWYPATDEVTQYYWYDGQRYTAPSPRTRQELWSDYQAQVIGLLRKSDITVLICVESSTPVPEAWTTYRKALRQILRDEDGDPAQPLPERPAYPPGT